MSGGEACIWVGFIISRNAYSHACQAQILTTLITFNGSNGVEPNALIQATDGSFYGTTQGANVSYPGGSPYNLVPIMGTVFKMTAGGAMTRLYTFTGTDGSQAGLIQATDGNFYGTTVEGGAGGWGTIFKITPAGTLTTLHSFSNSGNAVYAGIIEATDGNFYGTTAGGQTAGHGTVFKITPGGTLTTLHRPA
jgi:uncharacterized repeat protein (TIGR03803 family)